MPQAAAPLVNGQHSIARRVPFPLLLALPIVSGVLAWLPFPKINRGFVAWFALVPLLIFLRRERRVGRALIGGFAAGLVQFLGLLYWVPAVLRHYGGLPAPGAWGLFLLMTSVLGCYSAAACALTRFLMNRLGDGLILSFAAAWVSVEFVRGRFPFGGFPWLLLGYSQTESLRLIQCAEFFGVFGVSFLVAGVNGAIVWAWQQRRAPRIAVAPALVLGLLAAGCLAFGSSALRRWSGDAPRFTAALLQGNLSADEPESELSRKYGEGYIDMADALRPGTPDLVVLPESPSPLVFQYDAAYRASLEGLARRFPLGLIFNNLYFRGDNNTTRYYNSAYFLDSGGRETGRYDKVRLVPFGEYIPLKQLFFFTTTISKDVGDFTPGARFLTVPLAGRPANVIICFEAVFPQLTREFVRRGSRLIVNLTNDGWYGDSAAPYQHLAMAQWRAIEARRYLLRAANTGISAVIGPDGTIRARAGLLTRQALIGRFDFLAGETFYTRHGDVLPAACAILCCLMLVWSLLRGGPHRN